MSDRSGPILSGQAATDLESGEPPRRPRRGLAAHLGIAVKEILVVAVGALIVATLLRVFVGQAFLIPSGSMESTLQLQDRVVVEKLSTVQRGEVVVFADPGGWLPAEDAAQPGPVRQGLQFVGILPDNSTGHLTKRVIGLPGDQVVCCNVRGQITVNDQPLDERGYLYTDADGRQDAPSEIEFSVTVPADRMFVLGDHRSFSRDSRCHLNDSGSSSVKGDNAFVPLNLVVGRGVAVYWPLGHAARLKIPGTFATVPSGISPAPTGPSVQAGPDADC